MKEDKIRKTNIENNKKQRRKEGRKPLEVMDKKGNNKGRKNRERRRTNGRRQEGVNDTRSDYR